MNAMRVYSLLQDACRALDETGDHAIAAYVGMGMAMIEEKYGIEERYGVCPDRTDRD